MGRPEAAGKSRGPRPARAAADWLSEEPAGGDWPTLFRPVRAQRASLPGVPRVGVPRPLLFWPLQDGGTGVGGAAVPDPQGAGVPDAQGGRRRGRGGRSGAQARPFGAPRWRGRRPRPAGVWGRKGRQVGPPRPRSLCGCGPGGRDMRRNGGRRPAPAPSGTPCGQAWSPASPNLKDGPDRPGPAE